MKSGSRRRVNRRTHEPVLNVVRGVVLAAGQTARPVLRRALAFWLMAGLAPYGAAGYTLNHIVADKRDSRNATLGACPQLMRLDTQTPGKLIDRRWHTTLGGNILTTANSPLSARQNEIEQVIAESFAAWASVAGTGLRPASFDPLARTSASNACQSSDGLNSICFAQSDTGFSPGVLAFTNVVTSDILGERFPATAPPSVFIGEILDADVLFNPSEDFATPSALPGAPPGLSAFDLESVLIHELGHFFGFSHSGVWGAIMYPFVPPPGQFAGSRPIPPAPPDAPLSDDDRTGLRVLYPDATDMLHVGSIRGRIVPANPLSLAGAPAGVAGIFGAHVVAMDDVTGAVIGSVLGGWSCSGQGPAVFDGSYAIERLPVGRSYRVFVEPFDDPVAPTHLPIHPLARAFCRNSMTDAGWPDHLACSVPPANTGFTTRFRGQ